MLDKEDNLRQKQQAVENFQALKGQKFRDDIHPRRQLVLKVVAWIIGAIVALLKIHYWASLTSTIGISLPGSALLAFSRLLSYALKPFLEAKVDSRPDAFISITIHLLYMLPLELMTWFMIRAILRADFGWRKGSRFIPVVTFAQATHGERASERMKGQVTWSRAALLFALTCGIYYLLQPEKLYLIKPRGPQTPLPKGTSALFLSVLIESLCVPASLVGQGAQLWFNHCSRTFAGNYRLAMLLVGLRNFLDILNGFSGHLMGNAEIRPGFSIRNAAELMLVIIGCYQAWQYPKVLPEEQEGEEQ